MSAETLARNLAIALAVALVVLVIAVLPRLRQAFKEQPRPYWPLVALSAGVALVFQLINALVD